jgi:hypothetical protein
MLDRQVERARAARMTATSHTQEKN